MTVSGFSYTENYEQVKRYDIIIIIHSILLRRYIIIIISSSHRLPSTISAMDSRIRLRKNTIINSNTTNAMVDTTVNTNQVDFLFSLEFA